MKLSRVGIDLAKNVFQLHGVDRHGKVVWQAKYKEDRLSQWVISIAQRRHPNVAAVALANKTARMAWAMLRNDANYAPDFAIS